MSENRNGERPSIAIYERSSSELAIHQAGRMFQEIFGDDLDPKEWRLPNNDPLRVARYNSGENDIFIISHRHNRSHNDLKPIMDNNQRVETAYAIETNGRDSRMACFADDLIEESRVEEAIFTLFDQQDAMSAADFDSTLAALATERMQVTQNKDYRMIAWLQKHTELAVTPGQVRGLKEILRFLSS